LRKGKKINEAITNGIEDASLRERAEALVERMAVLGTKEGDAEHLKVGDDTSTTMQRYEQIGEEVRRKYEKAQELNSLYIELFTASTLMCDELAFL